MRDPYSGRAIKIQTCASSGTGQQRGCTKLAPCPHYTHLKPRPVISEVVTYVMKAFSSRLRT